jgi:hypothetical protein
MQDSWHITLTQAKTLLQRRRNNSTAVPELIEILLDALIFAATEISPIHRCTILDLVCRGTRAGALKSTSPCEMRRLHRVGFQIEKATFLKKAATRWRALVGLEEGG